MPLVAFEGPQGNPMAYMLDTVAKLTGATVKQLIHWDQTQLVRPSIASARGKGSRRVYSFLDVLAIKTAVMLRREGISLQKIRRCLRYLREHQPEVEQPFASLNMLTDGVSVFMLSNDPGMAVADRKVIDTLAGGQMLLMVPIGRLACEVKREAARLTPDFSASYPADAPQRSVGKGSQRAVRSVRKGVRTG